MSVIREYLPSDEKSWLRCRVAAFLDCSYWNDVKTEREEYSNPAICLVAEDGGQIIGLLDVELDSEDITNKEKGRCAMLWHLAVLPEYRRSGTARKLWMAAEQKLKEYGVSYCEVWTQQDEASNAFYRSVGFELDEKQTWIRCYLDWQAAYDFVNHQKLGETYAVEQIVFQAPYSRKAELEAICSRIDEVRMYSKTI